MKLAIFIIANLLCLGLIPQAQSQFGLRPGGFALDDNKDYVAKIVSQVEDQLKEKLYVIGMLFETTEEIVDSKHGQFDKVTIEYPEIVGFEEMTLQGLTCTINPKTDKLEINAALRTGKLQLTGQITFSRNGKEKEKTFVTKIKGSPFGYDVLFNVSPDGTVTSTLLHKTEPFREAVTFQTHIKKSDGKTISCDTAINSIANKENYHACMDIDKYINDKLAKDHKFEKTLDYGIKKVLSSLKVTV